MPIPSSRSFAILAVLLAGACAFFISYHEYKNNWNFRGSPSKMALRSAFVAFAFFFVAAIALGVVFQMVA